VADLTLDKQILAEARAGKLLSPARRRACVEHIKRSWLFPSVAPAARSVSIARHSARCRGAETTRPHLRPTSLRLAREYGRYGYRKITALLRAAGWVVNRSAWSASGDARG
jgi:hypothetical protein